MNLRNFIFLSALISGNTLAGPVLQMNKAFNSLMELMPFALNEKAFKEKKNEKQIHRSLKELSAAFKTAKHDGLIKHDLFAPSYELITENLKEVSKSFEKGKKDYSNWVLKETMSACLDCHTRLPVNYASSFQMGEMSVDQTKIHDPYTLGVTNLIVRRYVDAKENFNRSIQDRIIKKDTFDLIHPFQQILLIQTKIMKDGPQMISIIDDYISKKNLPHEIVSELESWKKRLLIWNAEKAVKEGLGNERELRSFIDKRLVPLKKESFEDAHKVDLLFASGILANYFFNNQDAPSAPELSFWMGWIEKRLKREEFLSSGDLFLKQCIKKYFSKPIAKECLDEYRESVEFDFSGSSGTHVPEDLKEELRKLDELVAPPKK